MWINGRAGRVQYRWIRNRSGSNCLNSSVCKFVNRTAAPEEYACSLNDHLQFAAPPNLRGVDIRVLRILVDLSSPVLTATLWLYSPNNWASHLTKSRRSARCTLRAAQSLIRTLMIWYVTHIPRATVLIDSTHTVIYSYEPPVFSLNIIYLFHSSWQAQKQHDAILEDCVSYRKSMGHAAELIALGVACDVLWEKLPRVSEEGKGLGYDGHSQYLERSWT